MQKKLLLSILDVVNENPVWLNKIDDSLFILLRNIEKKHQEFLLKKSFR